MINSDFDEECVPMSWKSLKNWRLIAKYQNDDRPLNRDKSSILLQLF